MDKPSGFLSQTNPYIWAKDLIFCLHKDIFPIIPAFLISSTYPFLNLFPSANKHALFVPSEKKTCRCCLPLTPTTHFHSLLHFAAELKSCPLPTAPILFSHSLFSLLQAGIYPTYSIITALDKIANDFQVAKFDSYWIHSLALPASQIQEYFVKIL